MKYYTFECGCSFPILFESTNGGNPALDFVTERDCNYNCPKMWELVSTGQVLGCFQIESGHARKYCKKLKPTSLDDLTALIAILRPGLIQALDPVDNKTPMADVFCKRKNGEIPIRVDFPAVESILSKTYQVLVYQEQQIKIGELLAGFSKAEADTKLRKNIAKKDPNLLFALEVEFVERCKKVGLVTEDQAKQIFGWIKAASRYVFNESHSASYSTLSGKTIFQKTHFPRAFYTSKLRSCGDKTNPNSATVSDFVNEAKLFNVEVGLPDFRDSKDTFYIKNKLIYFGLKNIKGFGDSTYKNIQESVNSFPDKDNLKNYTWNELLIKFLIQYKVQPEGKVGTPPRLISESIVENLIKAGAFSYFGKSRSELLAYYGLFSYLTHIDVKYLNGIMAGLDLNNTTSLFNAVARLVKDGGIFKSQPRLAGFYDEIKSFNSKKLTDSPLWVTFCEDSLLGVPITCQKIDSYDTSEANFTLKAFITGGNGPFLVFAADIEDVQDRVLAKGANAGETWASVILSDGTAKLSVAVWPEDYKRWASLLYKGNSVIIRGERGKGKYKDNLEIKQIEQAKAPTTHLDSANEDYQETDLTRVEF